LPRYLLLPKRKALRPVLIVILSVGLLACMLATRALAQGTEKIVHVFGLSSNVGGVNPYGGVVLDSAGNLYGTTNYGGAKGFGMVFEMSRGDNGQWIEKGIDNFGEIGDDEAYGPIGGLVFDQVGNLYGTTIGGGTNGEGGTLFELSPAANGKWISRTLYAFGNGMDGKDPRSTLIFDAAGNLYGTTVSGGTYGEGTVFRLSRVSGGDWQESVLYSFGTTSADAGQPNQPVAIDALGNIWGTTQEMGAYDLGAIYELSPNSSGGWTETIIHDFAGGADGAYPQCGLIFDASGNLYGTVGNGGANGNGYVFELSPSDGGWTMTTLHNFDGVDGFGAIGNLVFGPSGILYGVTWQGGSFGDGNVYALRPTADGTWREENLHSFHGGPQGCEPDAGVALDSAGNLYGTTLYCGSGQGVDGSGVVFEIVPPL
jgi:uncharacterized repeat protein (TIGR03803 family)